MRTHAFVPPDDFNSCNQPARAGKALSPQAGRLPGLAIEEIKFMPGQKAKSLNMRPKKAKRFECVAPKPVRRRNDVSVSSRFSLRHPLLQRMRSTLPPDAVLRDFRVGLLRLILIAVGMSASNSCAQVSENHAESSAHATPSGTVRTTPGTSIV
jgi:hypothetical protein